jgi:hypothetical protein
MSGIDLALASVVVAVGATVQGSIGFGLNVVAAPLLALISTDLVPGPALVAAFVLATLIGIRDRGGIDRAGFGWLFLGRLPGAVGAAVLVGSLPDRGIGIALASTVLAAVAMSVAGWSLQRTPGTLVAVGLVSGVMGTISSVGGPPVAMLYQDARGRELRGTLSAILAVGALTSAGLLAAFGRFGREESMVSLALLPGVLLGFLLSKWSAPFVDRGRIRPLVLGFSALAAIAALVRYAI